LPSPELSLSSSELQIPVSVGFRVKKEATEFVSVTRNQQEPKRKLKPMMMLELAQQKLKKLVT
jgi:hypothetical protein